MPTQLQLLQLPEQRDRGSLRSHREAEVPGSGVDSCRVISTPRTEVVLVLVNAAFVLAK